MIVLIGGEKGGTGKTTLATNLAAMRARAGRDVLLLDTDKQGSSSYWSYTRDEDKIEPRVPSVQKFGKGLKGDLLDLAGRYQDIVIDAGGRDSVELRASLLGTDRVFIPLQASQFDIWTLSRMNELVEQAISFNEKLKAFVVLNRASTHPSVKEIEEAIETVEEFEHLEMSKSVVRDRIAYRKAAREGRCVAEMDPIDAKAKDEITALYEEVFSE